jgi:RNA polymerase sigma-70 factor (ECF subfamily)
MDLGPSSIVDASPGPTLPEVTWVLPIPEERVIADDGDPADVVASRETIRLAFIAALQHLPARQRAVLILRDVLRWRAVEVADLLDASVASVNSALQRAHATLATRNLSAPPRAADSEQQDLLARYVDAFERFDVPRLVSLLHDDAVQSMPPYAMWLRGAADIGRWLLGPGIGCQGSRLVPTAANGSAAFGQYRPDGSGGHRPWALQVIEVSGDRISGLHNFLVNGPGSQAGGASDLFAAFGLPAHLGR